MEIFLSVRRLTCVNETCDKKTFAEQVDGLTARYGRRTPLLRTVLEKVAVALAGRAGARLARSLGTRVSQSTLLRLLMAIPDPAFATPKVLGVDDFAFRRGQVHSTILIDCETGAPIEVLATRDAEPLAGWLADHPGVEVICRDRSGAYADAARTGAPDAIQVADRFHLWQNIGKAVERSVAAHRSCLRAAGEASLEEGVDVEPTGGQLHSEEDPTGKFAERAQHHHAMVHDLIAEGHGIRGIARRLGWGRHTVQRYARAGTWQELVDGKWKGARRSKLDPFKPFLHQRWEAGCTNARKLYADITEQGFTGSYAIVSQYLEQYRTDPGPIPPPPPTVRQVTGWLTRHPDNLTEDDRFGLKAVLKHCPELQAVREHVGEFGRMLTELKGQDLPAWIAAVSASALPGLSSFARGLEADLEAVLAGLTMRWNSGPVEGRVNHIKMVKRQMFGRASLALLRKRILLTAATAR